MSSEGNGKTFRDDDKRKKIMEEKRDELIDTAAELLRFVKDHPSLWGEKCMTEVCNLAYEITSDPTKYKRHEEKPWGATTECLTKNISIELQEEKFLIMEESHDIYLWITHADLERMTSKIDAGEVDVNFRQWRFSGVDGDKQSVNIRLDSTLNTGGNMLTPGTIMHVQRFLPVYYRYDDNPQRKFAIVVREFKVVGRQELPEKLKGRPAQRANPKPASSARTSPGGTARRRQLNQRHNQKQQNRSRGQRRRRSHVQKERKRQLNLMNALVIYVRVMEWSLLCASQNASNQERFHSQL